MLTLTYSCPEDWNKMQPDVSGRFCSLCQEQVIDFSGKTNEEILALIKNKGNSFCAKSTAKQRKDFNQYERTQKFGKPAAVFLLGLLLSACNPSPIVVQEHKTQTEVVEYEGNIIADMMQSIPSPLETAMLTYSLDKNKEVFKKQKLLAVANLENRTPEQLAFLYGQYSVDLFYAYTYNETETVQLYYIELQKIEKLLGLDTIYKNRELIEKLLAKKELDSLLNITQQNFERLDKHTISHKQEHLAIHIFAGVFLESTYLLSVLHSHTQAPELRTAIGEQKLTVEQMVLVLEIYKAEKTALVYEDFTKLQDYYTKVSITSKMPRMGLVQRDSCGEMGLLEHTIESEVIVSEQDFKTLCEAIKVLREKYVLR